MLIPKGRKKVNMELQQANVVKTDLLHEEIFSPAMSEKSDKVKEQEKTLKVLKNKKDFDRLLESLSDCV